MHSDWLEFTLPWNGTESEVSNVLGLFDGGCALPHGGSGYTHSYSVLGSGRVLYNPERQDMGIHVRLPGSALGLVRDTPSDLCALVVAAGGHFTRVDIAHDTHTWTINDVLDSVRAGHLVSRTRPTSRTLISPLDGHSGGTTAYVGAPSSDCRVRIYDKAAEQGLTDGSVWTRFEVQFRHDKAQAVAEAIASGEPDDVAAYINRVIDFRELDSENVSRRTRCAWWAEWFGTFSGSLSFVVRQAVQELERMRDWVARQVAPTLSLLAKTREFGTWFVDALEDGWSRCPDWRKALLAVPAGT